ncbi:MAG: Fic family protein [Microvirga sp.]|jgi:Fic family protein|nr:Fic family protein [Microvirga sp.]
MTQWIWEQPGWPSLNYNVPALRGLEDRYLHLSGVAVGTIHHLPEDRKTAIKIDLFEEEAIDTSLIEGEILDRASVQSSLRRSLGLSAPFRQRERENGVAELMTAVASSFSTDLTTETLCAWHHLVVAGRGDVDEVGRYRTHPATMQIISGPIGRERIHYTAPPSESVPAEMDRFLAWFNGSPATTPALARAGIAHLWFETIHPFEDGNGRIGRAIAQMALGQAIGSAPIAMLSEIITRSKTAYYDGLNAAQRGGSLDDWLNYFAQTTIAAQERTIQRIRFIMAKTRFLDTHSKQMNDRQRKAVMRMFDAGPDGFVGGLSATNYRSITKATVPTTTRDLNDLVDIGVLRREGERRYARYHLTI